MTDGRAVYPTTLNDAGSAATTLVGAAPTMMVGDQAVDLTSVPPEVFERFPAMTPLHQGAEATVFSAVDDVLGPVVIKVYRRELSPTKELIDCLKGGEAAHLVKLYGAEHVGGRWVEVLELVSAGTLETLINQVTPDLLRSILQEMTDALEHFHSLGLVHRDIKPANVLVRQRTPLDLVLADFGLAAFVSDAVDLRAQDRTINYSSPETNSGVPGKPSADWWSLGMVLAEIAIGRHPFAELTDVEIVNHLAARDVDLGGISDPRWQRLLAGLLTRDAAHRWGAVEIRSWLAGNDPEVWRPSYAHPPYQFEGESFRTARELAAGLGEKWSAASALVGGTHGWTQLAGWLIGEAPGDSSRAARLDAVESATDPDTRLFRLLRSLAPDLVPVYRTFAIDDEGLSGLSASAAGGNGTASERAAITSLYANRVLGDRDADGRALDEQWHADGADLTRLTGSHTTLDDEAQTLARARLLAAACSADQRRALSLEASRVAQRDLMKIDWFAAVAQQCQTSTAAAVATLVLAPAAETALRDQRAQERSDRDDRRRKAHETTTERYPRTRRWLGWTTTVMGFVASASIAGESVTVPTGSLSSLDRLGGTSKLLDELLGSNAMRAAEDAVPGLIDYVSFVFTPVWSATLFVVGLVLWTRARKVGTANGPVRTEPERRGMQAVVVAGQLLFPVLIPISAVVSYRFNRGVHRHSLTPAQRRRRIGLFVAATGLLLHGVAMLATRLPSLGRVIFEFPSWYSQFLGEVPPQVFWTVNRADDLGWVMVLSFALAAAAYALGVRAYGDASANERRSGNALMVVGVAAFVPGVLVAGFFPIFGVAVVIGGLVALGLALYLIGLMLAGGD